MDYSWEYQIFASWSARHGGVVRRSRYWVERKISLKELRREVERRGFHLYVTPFQCVIDCRRGDGGLTPIC
jgi:hypothetical protein